MGRAYYRSRTLRELALAVRWPRLRRESHDLAHLAIFEETVLGPVQRDEALFLHGLVRVVRPQTVVEVGFLKGRSSLNFLLALDDDARIYSFDIDPRCEKLARERFAHDPRFTFRLRSQAELTQEDVDGRAVDFVFLDASHDLELNQATFERLLPMLTPEAIIAVHDTGTVPRELFPDWHWLLETREGWVGDEYEGQPGERAFVNWLLETHSGFAQVHLHTRRAVRCGVTLIQRSAPLPRSSAAVGHRQLTVT
ncbi:MAG: O-methyltransferase [Gaiellaceae bacterium]